VVRTGLYEDELQLEVQLACIAPLNVITVGRAFWLLHLAALRYWPGLSAGHRWRSASPQLGSLWGDCTSTWHDASGLRVPLQGVELIANYAAFGPDSVTFTPPLFRLPEFPLAEFVSVNV
jgi:hypothetical protein